MKKKNFALTEREVEVILNALESEFIGSEKTVEAFERRDYGEATEYDLIDIDNYNVAQPLFERLRVWQSHSGEVCF